MTTGENEASAVGGTRATRQAASLADCARILEQGDCRRAIACLDAIVSVAPSADGHALLGLARFLDEDYAGAAVEYEIALRLTPDMADWRDMFERAGVNARCGIETPVPAHSYFDSRRLLAPPEVASEVLPRPSEPAPSAPLSEMRRALGNLLGEILSASMWAATHLVGKLLGYKDAVWTNWYRRPVPLRLLTLAYMRDLLNENNLGYTTYPMGALTGFQQQDQSLPMGVTHFRTADGSWNNFADPKEGAAGTRFSRNVDIATVNPETGSKLLDPNPREISRKLLTRGEEMRPVPFLNLLAASWIQFQTHDWVSHGDMAVVDPHEIPLVEDDPFRRKYRQAKLRIGRTQPDPTHTGKDEPSPTFINEVTHWWDGSQIYGSDQETTDRLRSGCDGKLGLREDGTLPLGPDGVEDTGFVRNWWVGLAMFHTLFAKEHNAICDHLRQAYPGWDDARLFNVARLVNAAVMANIHTVEWTPAILPNRGLEIAMNANWYGLATYMMRKPGQRKTYSKINIRHPELGGVVGNPINKHGVPFALTQEFVEVYRLHSLLPEQLSIRWIADPQRSEEISMAQTRQAGSRQITERIPMADLFLSFGSQHPGQLVLNNYPKFLQEMSIAGNPVLDLGALDILRARERGVPRYNTFRRQLGLNPISSFDDLTDDEDHRAKLRDVYGGAPEDVEKLDLMIGTLAEGHRPCGFGFGETMFQIFILNATRRLQADRFYTDCYNEETYTPEGLAWIDRATLKQVLLRHYPVLEGTGLANVENAFEPWDEELPLDRRRHPLAEFDR